ncbi:MAG: hypothetical protein UR61_C0041G0007 [candidate division WS6 bacterium GW2011_GWE1_34_7]|uniref:Uncharacterized protein n=1 Tax=candidate division WS6 bacterium GW2011_GWE1_34_7 TaxID=1619093 RepID=A0A0G0DNR5_9BACT|nr:MAG: hypothetical protein UR61_C0041G0007 [candidate division WS6 bacterium GW2011_GWE1_34_7]
MAGLLDKATIKIIFKMQDSFLAIVNLNWEDEFEVRYFRITLRSNGSLWFQPPATGISFHKSFIVDDKNKWHELESKVLSQFLAELKEQIDGGRFSDEWLIKIKHNNTEEIITDEELNEIDKAIS